MIKLMFKRVFYWLPIGIRHNIRRNYFKYRHNNLYIQQQNMRKKETDDGYSFKPFDQCGCIFIHIPKCAGVSVSKALFGNLAGGHSRVVDYQLVFNSNEYSNYFKFTFVRNPWDRLVSAFFFLKKGGFNDADKKWAKKHLHNYNDFNEFVRKWVNKKNIWKYHHFRPQYFYLQDSENRISVDFIGYLENINNDFEYIRQKIGSNAVLTVENKSVRSDYKDLYDEDTIKIVADVYKIDINLLGYSFDNSSIKEQLFRRDKR